MKIDISPIDKKGRGLFDARRGRVRVRSLLGGTVQHENQYFC